MDAARRGKWIGFLCLGVTAFGWALNWPLMKLLLQQWPPLFARGLAGVAAALILFAIAKARGQPLEVPREAVPRLLFASFTNVFAWMGFATVAMKFVPVGEGALIVYTMPIWATLLAWPLGRHPAKAGGYRSARPRRRRYRRAAGRRWIFLRRRTDHRDRVAVFRGDPVCDRQHPQPRGRCRCRRWSWSPGRSGSAASRC